MESVKEVMASLPDWANATDTPRSQEAYEQERTALYNASKGSLHEKDGWNCDICSNKGYIGEVEQNEMFGYYSMILKPCKCMRVRNALKRLEKSGLGDVVHTCTFDKYETPQEWQKDIKETALRFVADDSHNWFYIGGQSGAGKSHICTAIAIHYIRQAKNVRYMMWLDDIDRIKNAVTDADAFEDLMNTYKNADVLYIDDLFKPVRGSDGRVMMPSGADIRRTFEIINYRYNLPGAVTIISSEKTIDELLDVDQALGGRIFQLTNAGGYCISLDHDIRKNYRLQGVVK